MREVSRLETRLIYIFMLVFAVTFQGIPTGAWLYPYHHWEFPMPKRGTLMSFWSSWVFISIPGGILADVYGSRYVGMVSLVITLVGSLLVGFGNSYFILVIGRIISGIGALTIAIIAPGTLSHLV